MIVDCHTHVFPSQIQKKRAEYIDADPCFAILYSQKNARLATAEELIASMDKDGIEVSVITNIGWTTHELCVETNDYILESIARYPSRLIGFGAVQPLVIDAAIEEIERCVKSGIRGIGEIRPDMQMLDMTDSEVMAPFMAALKKYKLPLLIHSSEPVGHDYPGKGGITPYALYQLITDYPDVSIICAHWGGGLPFYALMPEVKEALRNVYFDTAASPFLYRPEVYQQVSQLVGDDKVLFGSDWPLLPQGRLLKEINGADLSPEARDRITSDNARRLLGIK